MKNLLLISLIFPIALLAQPQPPTKEDIKKGGRHITSIKYSKFKPAKMGEGVEENSIEYDSTQTKAVSYSSPKDSTFGISLSAVFDKDNEVDQIQGLLKFGGIVTEVETGEISGKLTPTGDTSGQATVLPGQQNLTSLFNTLLPSKSTFNNEFKAYKIGYGREEGIIQGAVYFEYALPTPVIVDVTNNDPNNMRPTRIIDANSTFTLIGYWMKVDYLAAAFLDKPNKMTWAVSRKSNSLSGIGFGPELMTGFGKQEKGPDVENDYKTATGLTLDVADTWGWMTYLNYDLGYFYLQKFKESSFSVNAGVEGRLALYMDFGDDTELLTSGLGNTNEVDGEFEFNGLISVGFFVRVAYSF